ncbi:MAG: hypothetical protein ACE5JA_05450 [bacterium]
MPRSRSRLALSLSWVPVLMCSVSLFSTTSSAVELQNLELVFTKTYRCLGLPSDTLNFFGRSISTAGDVNGDGYDDVIVAAAEWNPVLWWVSKAFIFFGGDPMDTIPDVVLTGDYDGEALVQVCGAGDFNSDGFDDVVMSNHGDQGVRVFFGGNPMDTIYDVLLMNRMTSSFANSISPAGDVNGDGFDDIVVGDYMTNGLNGSAAIFFGATSPDGWPDLILWGQRGEGFGMQVAGGGDLNCDGYDDIVVGEPDNSESTSWAGKMYVFFGGDPMDTTPDVWMYGEGPNHWLGLFELDIVNVDTLCDWVGAGTEFYPDGFPAFCPGKVYVLFGDTLMDGIPDAAMLGRTDSSGLGMCTRSAGRIVATGFEGLLSGASAEYDYRGSSYLWLTNVPFDTVPDGIATGSYPEETPAWLVATAGDVDGDGYDEVMFSNYASLDSMKTVWVCKYTGTGVFEEAYHESAVSTPFLMQNTPNPFSNSTLVCFRLSGDEDVCTSLNIHDVAGRLVRNLWSSDKADIETGVGTFTARWDGRDEAGNAVPSGVYFCRLRTGEFEQARKMVLLR